MYRHIQPYGFLLACGLLLLAGALLPPRASTAQTPERIYLPLVMHGESEQEPPSSEVYTGEGTFYGATGAGNCSFDATPDNLMVAAMNHTDYDNALLCGAYVEVTGPKGTVTVRIVDRCPECAPGDIDLSQEAFALIADPVAGRVPISWHIVSGDVSGPIVYRFKEGSNPFWTAVQIRNHRNPVASVAYLDDAGEWQAMVRQQYNYFVEPAGLGAGPYTFQVIDIYGNVLVDSGIPLQVAGEVPGSEQFPPRSTMQTAP